MWRFFFVRPIYLKSLGLQPLFNTAYSIKEVSHVGAVFLPKFLPLFTDAHGGRNCAALPSSTLSMSRDFYLAAGLERAFFIGANTMQTVRNLVFGGEVN